MRNDRVQFAPADRAAASHVNAYAKFIAYRLRAAVARARSPSPAGYDRAAIMRAAIQHAQSRRPAWARPGALPLRPSRASGRSPRRARRRRCALRRQGDDLRRSQAQAGPRFAVIAACASSKICPLGGAGHPAHPMS